MKFHVVKKKKKRWCIIDNDEMVEISYEEGLGQKGLIFSPHHILGQSHNPMAVAVAVGMVGGSGGFLEACST